MHELIALAVGITTRCDGCISAYTKKTAGADTSLGGVSEALRVAVTLNAGAALVYSSRVVEVFQQLN